MSQFVALTAQTHRLETTRHFAEALQLLLQRLIGDERGNTGDGDPCGGHGERGHLQVQPVHRHTTRQQIVHHSLLFTKKHHSFLEV